MQCHDGMHLLHQSIIGYVKPTARPPPYSMA
jgi:hypothetical protein